MKEFIEKLIGRLEEYKKQWMDADYLDGIDEIIEIVNELAEEYSANTPQKSAGGWIPVTERLPEYNEKSEYYEEVIVTLDDGRVTVGCYRNLDEEWWVNAESGTKHAIDATGHVIAWQPLPELYEAEKPAEWKDAVMNHFTKIE
jgi:hypothetical protein